MKQQNNTDAELTPEGAYPHKLECVMAKLGLSSTISSLVSTPNGACSWPTASASGEGVDMQQSGCSNSWLPDPLEVCMERWEQKREERRKNQLFELRLCPFLLWNPSFGVLNQVLINTPGMGGWTQVMAWWAPLGCSTCSSSSPGKEGGRRDTGWAQPNLSLCVWSGCEIPWRDEWKLLGNSKSKKKMEMRIGNGRDTMQSGIEGYSGEERLRIEDGKQEPLQF